MKKILMVMVSVLLLAGCQAVMNVQSAAQEYVNAYCSKPLEQRAANRVVFNSGLNGHQIQVKCAGDN